MNILITGITGLFGSQLAKEFSALGQIFGLVRPEQAIDSAPFQKQSITLREGELADFDSLYDALDGIDLVIHSAGLVSFSSDQKENLIEVNTEGTKNLVNAMLSKGVKKLIHVSSVAAIGRSAEYPTIDEEFKWVESPLNTGYAVSKYLGELEVWRAAQEGLDVLVVNPSILLGKANYGKSSSAIYSYVLEENPFYPKGDLNYIDLRDAAQITRQLVEKEQWGERFILNANSISYRDFFEQVANAFGKKAPSLPLKNWMIWMGSLWAWVGNKAGFSKSPLNRQTALLAQQKITFSNQKIQQLLNFKFTPLKETLDWAKNP